MRHLGMLVCPRAVAVYTCGRADFENEIRLFLLCALWQVCFASIFVSKGPQVHGIYIAA